MTDDLRHQGPERHGPELAINERYLMAVVDQGAAYAEQAEGRQLLLGNATANRRVWYVHQKNTHINYPAAISRPSSHRGVKVA